MSGHHTLRATAPSALCSGVAVGEGDTKKHSRPSMNSNKGIVNAVLRTAPNSLEASQGLALSFFPPDTAGLSLQDFECVLSAFVSVYEVQISQQWTYCQQCQTITCISFAPASEFTLKIHRVLLREASTPSHGGVAASVVKQTPPPPLHPISQHNRSSHASYHLLQQLNRE